MRNVDGIVIARPASTADNLVANLEFRIAHCNPMPLMLLQAAARRCSHASRDALTNSLREPVLPLTFHLTQIERYEIVISSSHLRGSS